MTVFRRVLLLTGLAVCVDDALGATFCVGNATELSQALLTAADNGEDDIVRIRIGHYEHPSGNTFVYFPAESRHIAISGGYIGSSCGVVVSDPSSTVISGAGKTRALFLYATNGSSGNQSLSNLTITDGYSSEQGAGLAIGGNSGFTGNVRVSSVVIARNVATGYSGGMSLSTEGFAEVTNSLFLLNRCGSGYCGFNATINAGSPADIRGVFGNNTIVGNRCIDGEDCSVAGARYGGSASSVFHNNVFAANQAGDLRLQNFAGSGTSLYNNNVVALDGSPPAAMANNIAFANPRFVDLLNEDFRPAHDSPLRDAGTNAFNDEAFDIDGEPRVNGASIDIGAFESQFVVFGDGFEEI